MKKPTLFLIGVGLTLVLTAGSFESSPAEEKGEAIHRYSSSSDSSRASSLQERVKRNSLYLKQGRVKPEKVASEFLSGGFWALAGGVVGGAAGLGIRCATQSGYDPWDNDDGLVEVLVGYLVGSNLGCAAGVYMVGNSDGETGSYGAALGGSLAGTLVSGLFLADKIRNLDKHRGWAPFFIFTAAQAGGATIIFNLAGEGKNANASAQALLNLDDAKLTLGFPQVHAYQDSSGSGNYKVNLFQANL